MIAISQISLLRASLYLYIRFKLYPITSINQLNNTQTKQNQQSTRQINKYQPTYSSVYQQVFPISSYALNIFLSLHINLIIMKKQKCYLPNLNTIVMNNRFYQLHINRLNHAKSQYQIPNSKQILIRRGERQGNEDIQHFKTIETERPFMEGQQMKNVKTEEDEGRKRSKVQMYNLMDLKQKLNNLRVLDLSSKRHQQYFNVKFKEHQDIKERISKFIKEGSKVSYKYKKSLLSIEKRRRQKEEDLSERSGQMNKSEFLKMIRQPFKTNNHSLQDSQIQDIFYGGMEQKEQKRQGKKTTQQISDKIIKNKNQSDKLHPINRTPYLKLKTEGQADNSNVFSKRDNIKKGSFNYAQPKKVIRTENSSGLYIKERGKEQLGRVMIKKGSRGKQRMADMHVIEVYNIK